MSRPARYWVIAQLLRRFAVGVIAVGYLSACGASAPWAAGLSLEGLTSVTPGNDAIALIREKWFGSPAIWTPPPLANTDFQFFDVGGHTQAELIASIKKAAICDTHKCLPDPAVPPGGTALGLAGMESPGSWSTPYCYSPMTMTALYRTYILLPRWSPLPYGGVTIPLVEKWNALERVVYTHEAGHVAIDVADLAALNDQAHASPSCAALRAFWANPSIFDKLNADQNAYHARLRADCRPEVGCFPSGWMGWF
jgi:hypothetical protein